MRKLQKKVEEFNKKRKWDNISQIKDILLNINEEVGEAWNIIKWVNDKKTIKRLITKHSKEFEDFIGDMAFLVLKIANITKIDAQKATEKLLKEWEKRFPVKEVKGWHVNISAGGVDKKYKK